MKPDLSKWLNKNARPLIALGALLMLGGIALAYFTNDADPWGTLGGVICALGLMLALGVISVRRKETSNKAEGGN